MRRRRTVIGTHGRTRWATTRSAMGRATRPAGRGAAGTTRRRPAGTATGATGRRAAGTTGRLVRLRQGALGHQQGAGAKKRKHGHTAIHGRRSLLLSLMEAGSARGLVRPRGNGRRRVGPGRRGRTMDGRMRHMANRLARRSAMHRCAAMRRRHHMPCRRRRDLPLRIGPLLNGHGCRWARRLPLRQGRKGGEGQQGGDGKVFHQLDPYPANSDIEERIGSRRKRGSIRAGITM